MRIQTVAFATKNNSFFKLALMIALIMTASVFASAQTTTFGQFIQLPASNHFYFNNNGTNGQFSQVAGGVPVVFFYSNISNLDSSLQGSQSAHVFVTSTTTAPAIPGSTIVQPFNNTVTVQIIRDTPAPAGVGTGSRTNLLTAVFSTATSDPSLSGSGGSATFQGSTPDHNVTFTSDFLGFALTTQRNGSLSFSSVNPTLSIGGGGFLDSFTAAATGTFASNPPPIYNIPSAASVSVSGKVVTPSGNAVRRAPVVLTETDGTVHTAYTNAFGLFNFDGIPAGQFVTLNSNSKRYSFPTMVVGIGDSVNDLTIVTDQ